MGYRLNECLIPRCGFIIHSVIIQLAYFAGVMLNAAKHLVWGSGNEILRFVQDDMYKKRKNNVAIYSISSFKISIFQRTVDRSAKRNDQDLRWRARHLVLFLTCEDGSGTGAVFLAEFFPQVWKRSKI